MFHPPTILYTMSYDTGVFIILCMYGMNNKIIISFDVSSSYFIIYNEL